MISNNGILAYYICQEAINSAILTDFLNNNLIFIDQETNRSTIVMDNAKFHHSNNFKEICSIKRYNLKYLPAYTPQLNPIEEVFSAIKSHYNNLELPKNTFEDIKLCIEMAMSKIEVSVFEGVYRNMRRLIDIALSRNPFI
ncbi:hypothetical protein DMUE_3887 [Dictyocoela muelleri]|nr:hypothetical protein DMUE_3887 [Dictyocoela muelleri]